MVPDTIIQLLRICGLIVLLCGITLGEESPVNTTTPDKSEQSFVVEGPNAALRVKFEDLELRQRLGLDKLPVDVEQQLPQRLKTLDGKVIRIKGEMFPPPTESGLTAFAFQKYVSLTSFGRPVHADEKIGVRMREGVTTDYIQSRQFDVVGKLTIKPRVRNKELMYLHVIEDAVVIDQ
ncbi:MAG: hypothetical protein DWH91_08505 [Planctomycetota bacterium]|nr:MAG: hypothetical protein DWH91_08505 [Planctomycetota bacterium]